MMHCTNCTFFRTPCDYALSRGLAQGLFCMQVSFIVQTLSPGQIRSGQTRSHLISSSFSGSGPVSSFCLSYNSSSSHRYSPGSSYKSPTQSVLSDPSSTPASRLSQPPALRHPITVPTQALSLAFFGSTSRATSSEAVNRTGSGRKTLCYSLAEAFIRPHRYQV